MFPELGQWVNDLLNDRKTEQSIRQWRWKILKLRLKAESFDDEIWSIGVMSKNYVTSSKIDLYLPSFSIPVQYVVNEYGKFKTL
jgi:hypothetical protein